MKYKIESSVLMDLVRIAIKESLNGSFRVVADFPFHVKIEKMVTPYNKTTNGKLEEVFDLFDFEIGVKRSEVTNKKFKENSYICFEAITEDEFLHKKQIYYNNPVSVIPTLYSDNLDSLKKDTKNFITNLIKGIVEPVFYCPTCKGNGIICQDKFGSIEKS